MDDVFQVAIRQYDKLSKIIGLIGGLFSVLYQVANTLSFPFILTGLKLDLVNWITNM